MIGKFSCSVLNDNGVIGDELIFAVIEENNPINSRLIGIDNNGYYWSIRKDNFFFRTVSLEEYLKKKRRK